GTGPGGGPENFPSLEFLAVVAQGGLDLLQALQDRFFVLVQGGQGQGIVPFYLFSHPAQIEGGPADGGKNAPGEGFLASKVRKIRGRKANGTPKLDAGI